MDCTKIRPVRQRFSTICSADLILVMNEGDIVEQGNHKELLERGDYYAELYNSQFERPVDEGEMEETAFLVSAD